MGTTYPNQSGCCKNCVACLNNALLLVTYQVRQRESRQPLASQRGWSQLVWPWPCGLWVGEEAGCSEKRRRLWSMVQRGPGQRRRQMLVGLLLLHATAGHALRWESTSWSGSPLEHEEKQTIQGTAVAANYIQHNFVTVHSNSTLDLLYIEGETYPSVFRRKSISNLGVRGMNKWWKCIYGT